MQAVGFAARIRWRKANKFVIARALCARGNLGKALTYSHRLSIKAYKPIASVAALTAQPLAALPPYGCGVPFTGVERLAGRRLCSANSVAQG